MTQSDVRRSTAARTWGGSQTSLAMRLEAGKSLGTKSMEIESSGNVRGRKLAGWSETRGSGEYLVGFILLLVTSLVPIAHNMPKQPKLTEEGLIKVLDSKFTPWLVGIDQKLSSQESELQQLSSRLETVEKVTGVSKPASSGSSSGHNLKKTPAKTGLTMAEVVSLSPPVRDQAGLTAAIEEEDRKNAGNPRNRHRDMDYSNRMKASAEQIERYEDGWDKGYRTLGFYPNGTQSDFERGKDEIMENNGGREPTQKEIERYCITEYLAKDMGMTEDCVDSVWKEVELYFFEGNTSYLRFHTRNGVIQVYLWANQMNKMAAHNRVTRKLHVWVCPQLESRFFQLKNLEYTYRNARKAKGDKVQTRIYYKERSIFAQWRLGYDMDYEDIREPPSAKIPGVEFWRNKSHPRLNSRPNGAPLYKPLENAPIPTGRVRKDEESFSGRGRGGSRGRGGRGGRGGITPGAFGRSAGSGDALPPAQPGTSGSEPMDSGLPGNANATSSTGRSFKELGGSGTVVKAGRGRPRGTPNRVVKDLFKSTSIKKFLEVDTSKPKRSRDERGDSDDEEYEENKNPRTQDKRPTPTKAAAPSPTKDEMDAYMAHARKLHKQGLLKLDPNISAGSLGLARVNEHMKLYDLVVKEGNYYDNLKKKVKEGKKDISKKDLQMDEALFKAERKKVMKHLSVLTDKSLETVALNCGLNDTSEETDSSDSSSDSSSSSSSSSSDEE